MCRFMVYKGKDPILLSHLILDPTHSILTQSYDSRLRLDTRRPHNGDGFGVGYYTAPALLPHLGPDPCIFTSTIPAWNCVNLTRLASKTVSPLIFAHVRASTQGALSDSNCHPFNRGCLMWMHNGGIGSWNNGVKRRLVSDVGDEFFSAVQGSTDSEWAFALFLDSLQKMGYNPDGEEYQTNGFGHTVLRQAILMTIKRINGYLTDIPENVRGQDDRSLLNFAITDGKSVVCTRYVSSKTDEAASLFFSSGTSWKRQAAAKSGAEGKGDYRMERRDRGADIVLVASEPLTFERDNWVTVPTNSTLTIHNQTVLIHPIMDEFYNPSPSFKRSSAFAATKGQITTEMAKASVEEMSRENRSDTVAAAISRLGVAAG